MKVDHDKIPLNVQYIMNTLDREGYETYIVGGAVRDLLSGKKPKDWDLVTQAFPAITQALFSGNTVDDNNSQKYGTVFVKSGDSIVEVTTMRKDIKREGIGIQRKPEVEYTLSIFEDANRRDFTVNALYMDSDGMVLDPTGHGENDITSNILRFVGKPLERIIEDPLRIMRAIRFVAKGYTLHGYSKVTLMERKMMRDFIRSVSIERVRDEFMKSLVLNVSKTVYYMLQFGMLEEFFPELYAAEGYDQEVPEYHKYGLLEHSVRTAEWLRNSKLEPVIVLAGLLHDIGKPLAKIQNYNFDGSTNFVGHAKIGAELAEKRMREMKFSNFEIHYVKTLIRHHMRLQQKHSTYNLQKTSNLMWKARIRSDYLMYLFMADRWGSRKEEVPFIEIPRPITRLPVNNKGDLIKIFDDFHDNDFLKGEYPKEMIGMLYDRAWEFMYKHPKATAEGLLEAMSHKSLIRSFRKKLGLVPH